MDDMMVGYMDGLRPDTPEPSGNRSASYRHGFANGRDDRSSKPRASADNLRAQAKEARDHDTI